ncbi:hypothetical protein V5O48_000170, partial [Marasmius crinis-equi]
MSKVTFNGKEYDVKGLAQDTVGLAEELARNAKIIELKIVAIIDVLPRTIVTGWWNAFIAQYLPSLITALKSASLRTQTLHLNPSSKSSPSSLTPKNPPTSIDSSATLTSARGSPRSSLAALSTASPGKPPWARSHL